MRIAAIDIGTVTCRLLIGDVVSGRIVHEVYRACEIVNLGIGVDKTGLLQADAIKRVCDQVAEYVRIIDAYSPDKRMPIYAVATSASRDAANTSELIAALAEVGVHLTVISGTTEANLSFQGASLDFADEPLMVVDIGGGSTEIIVGPGTRQPRFVHSFDVGCRRVTERFLHGDPPTPAEQTAARSWIYDLFAPVFQQAQCAQAGLCNRIVAVAGTPTSVVSIREHMEVYDSRKVHGSVVSRQELQAVFDQLVALPLIQREHVVGLEPKRAPVILAGLIILDVVCELAHKDAFTVSESDILQGILLAASAGSLPSC